MPAFEPNRLKVAAEERYMTLPVVARELGVSEKTVYRWNAGANQPRAEMVRRIAALLDRDAAWFFESGEAKAAA